MSATPTLTRMTDEQILDHLAEGTQPQDIAAWMCEDEVAAGEYDGCSSELELAYGEHVARCNRILRDAGGR